MQEPCRTFCSVIIPVYNVMEWLPESLDSLLPQATGELQVILVDDGSTDGSGELCDAYRERFPCCRVIHQGNRGVASARNTGLREASGEYILWMDPDDLVCGGWYPAIREKLLETRPDILLFDYQTLYGGNLREKAYNRPEGKVGRETFMADLIRNVHQVGSLLNKAFKRTLLDGFSFDESMKCMEDMNLLFRIVPFAENIVYMSRVLYTYRLRDDGLVRRPDLETAYRCYREALKYEQYAAEKGFGPLVLGVLPHARGFCCKYYSQGCPPEYDKEYNECRKFLTDNRKTIRNTTELSRVEKIKYLLIPYRLVGRLYAGRIQ